VSFNGDVEHKLMSSCVSSAKHQQTGESCAVKKVTNVFTKKVSYPSFAVVWKLTVDIDETMSARAALAPSLPGSQECE